MKRISTHDEEPMLFTRWTQSDSDLRDKCLSQGVNYVLMPEQRSELERMRRFSPGDKVRTATVDYLRRHWWQIRDKVIADHGGVPGSRDLDRYINAGVVA